MTTKVRIEIVQEHMPVVVEVLDESGRVRYVATLQALTACTDEYVHSGQTIRVREMTTAEAHFAANPQEEPRT
jgi:PII-like signaling protein